MGAETIPPSIDGSCSYFADNERLVIKTRLMQEFDESIEFGADFIDWAECLLIGGIPAWIGVEADDIDQIKVEVFYVCIGCVGDESSFVKLPERTDHLFINLPRLGLAGITFIEETPEDDARVVEAVFDHPRQLAELRFLEGRIQKMVFAVAPADGFLPDQNAVFITKIQKTLVLRIMGAADEIASRLFEQLDVFKDNLQRQGGAEFRMGFMAAVAAKL